MLKIYFLLVFIICDCNASFWDQHSERLEFLTKLTKDNFDPLVIGSTKSWLIGFATNLCEKCVESFIDCEDAIDILQDYVLFGGVDCTHNSELANRYNVTEYPTILLFMRGHNPVVYKGKHNAKELSYFVVKEINRTINTSLENHSWNSKNIVKLRSDNVQQLLTSKDMWLIEIYAHWSEKCLNFKAIWNEVAEALEGKVKVAVLESADKSQLFNVNNFPAIKYFPAGVKNVKIALNYTKKFTASDIIDWALKKLSNTFRPVEIVTMETFTKHCTQKPWCSIMFFPKLSKCNAKCRKSLIREIINAAIDLKQYSWGWVWVSAGSQPELEEALDIGGFGYPALAVVNSKKLKYSIFRGSFSKEGINEFLRDTSLGRGRTSTIKNEKLPKIVTTEPWDGKDGELPPEEDIDLSDIDDLKDEL